MRSHSSLLMAFVVARSVIVFARARGARCSDSKAFPVGRSIIVFARAARCGKSSDGTADSGEMLEEAKCCTMRSQSSLLMAVVALAGNASCVAAIFVVFDPEVGCGAIVGRPIVVFARAACWSDFTEGLGSARHSDDTVDFGEMLQVVKGAEMRSHISLVGDAERSLAVAISVSEPSGCNVSHLG